MPKTMLFSINRVELVAQQNYDVCIAPGFAEAFFPKF